jgi:hypothetical protein
MKNLFLFVVAISILFVMGCQENAITDPLFTDSPGVQAVTNVTTEKNLPRDFTDHPNIIKFRRVVNLRNVPNTYFVVSGTIKVDFKTYNLSAGSPSGGCSVTVGLSIDAEMKEMEYGNDLWTIKENSTNTVYLAEGEATSLVKYFKVKGRSDGMLLACNFEVALDGVALQGMWITFPRVHSPNNVAQ